MSPSARAIPTLALLPLLAPPAWAGREKFSEFQLGLDLEQQEPGPLMEFYIYRAGQSTWPGSNSDRARSANFANAAGVLRYIHNEVVGRNVVGSARPPHCMRKYEIDRIYRYKVVMRSTPEAMRRHHHGFLGFVAIDRAKCTVPHCAETWWKPYGYVPGCQDQDEKAFHYPDAVWYSFPGRCPDRTRDDSCWGEEELENPGGACRPIYKEDGEKVVPDGTRNCTYYYEPAGEVDLDELVGIKQTYGDYKSFCEQDGVEFNGPHDDDEGVTLDFWKGYKNLEKNKDRVRALMALFQKRYPHVPLLDDPSCGKPWVRPSYWPLSDSKLATEMTDEAAANTALAPASATTTTAPSPPPSTSAAPQPAPTTTVPSPPPSTSAAPQPAPTTTAPSPPPSTSAAPQPTPSTTAISSTSSSLASVPLTTVAFKPNGSQEAVAQPAATSTTLLPQNATAQPKTTAQPAAPMSATTTQSGARRSGSSCHWLAAVWSAMVAMLLVRGA